MLCQRIFPAGPARPQLVIALHCSGTGGGQWRQLRERLGAGYELVAPEHYGTQSAGPWTGEHAFRLADEAARTLAIIDADDRKVHLVGHSYGGGVALHVALERPQAIASLTLYEPSAFHLLEQIDGCGAEAFADILAIARNTGRRAVVGDYRGAAAGFFDYWNGDGAWDLLRPDLQRALTQWAPKAPLDFAALIREPTVISAYTGLRAPALIMRGEHAPAPTHHITETLPRLLPDVRLAVVAGAGHMGPLTHAAQVNALIAQHLSAVGASRRRSLPDSSTASGDYGPFPTTRTARGATNASHSAA